MKNWLPLAVVFGVALPPAGAEEYTGLRAIIREHVKHDGQIDATLASTTGWHNVQGFSYQMLLVDDEGATPTRMTREFVTGQRFKIRIEAHTDLWIYVMNVEPDGKTMVTLLPEEGESHMLVKAGKTVLVPPDATAFRFKGDPGVEQFRIIASPVKLKWVNPEALWKLENGAKLPPDEERVALAASETRHKSLTGIKSLQEKKQHASGELYTKSLPDLVQTLEKNPEMKAMVKDVVLVPPPSEVAAEPADRHRQDVIMVSDEAESDDAIVIDIKLKHK